MSELTERTKKQKENLRELVAALRSGDYKQGQGRLHFVSDVDNKSKFCCLGVGAEVCIARGYDVERVPMNAVLSAPRQYQYLYKGVKASIEGGYLPEALASEAFGLSELDQNALARKNDSGVPFEDIAAYIEVKYL